MSAMCKGWKVVAVTYTQDFANSALGYKYFLYEVLLSLHIICDLFCRPAYVMSMQPYFVRLISEHLVCRLNRTSLISTLLEYPDYMVTALFVNNRNQPWVSHKKLMAQLG